ncbi:MAG: penicillin-binding protein 2 [Paludibacteraceae bacterium]|nr:penicillin-binding protein 2 [Paludibacteraceae bacterium]
MVNDIYYKRKYIISIIIVSVVVIFIIRLFAIQILDETAPEKAAKNAQLTQIIYPSRGLIFDRNDSLLVFNHPVYDVMLIFNEMGKNFDTLSFCSNLSISQEEFNERTQQIRRQKNRGFSKYTPQLFLSQLTKENISRLQEHLYLFPGVSIRKRTLRDYTYNSASHILGNVGEVTSKELENDSYYQIGDYCGRDGIEKVYESHLRGIKGKEILMRDSHGRIQGSYDNGRLDEPAQMGEDIQTTLDINLQMHAEELMTGKIGSVVAIEPQTGEVLALVSSPYWNPKDLVGRNRTKQYNALLKDPQKPLLNRATQALYSPGSTFKLLQALVCLQKQIITPNTKYACSGRMSTPIRCTHDHGSPVTLVEAIEQSCNPYFWCAYRDLLQKDGYGNGNADFKRNYKEWRNDIISFGFGSTFADSDIPQQASGSIPSEKLYNKIYGNKGWKAITIRSLSIGQGEILVTPLQLANMTAVIANKGYYISPHICRTSKDTTNRIHHSTIDSVHFDCVQQGMAQVMTNGTGKWYNVQELQICGKTGTVQNPHGKDHAIFIGFAPQDNPQIAIAVVVENAGFGSTWACPIASLLIEQYLTKNISRPELYNRMSNSYPKAEE